MFDIRLGRILVIAIGIYSLAFTGKVQLTGDMHARSTAKFEAKYNNIKYVLAAGTTGEIVDSTHFPSSGNYGLYIQITSGPYKGEKVWVHYNRQRPHLKLNHQEPRLAQTGVTTRPTPASTEPPREVAIGHPITSQATAATGACFNCSQPRPPSNPAAELATHTLRNPLAGALRTMAAIYQSCEVLKQRPYDPATDSAMGASLIRRGSGFSVRVLPQQNLSRFVADHYYLNHYNQGLAPQCLDMRLTPPVYHYGGRPAFRGNEIDLFQVRRTGGAPMTGIDCSAFVSTALSVSGLKLTPWARTAESNMATSRSLFSYNEQNSCFNRPVMNSASSIKSGDIIAYPGHTFMIDQVGEDPLGIEKAKESGRFPRTAEGCSRMEPKRQDLNFSIIQSSGYGDMPAMRIEAKNYSTGFPEIRNLVVQACLAEFNQTYNPRNFGTLLLRHKGDSDPRCLFPEDQMPKLKGEECTQGCTQEII